jgi:hypothetical protein
METTLTMAGLLADAGAARLRGVSTLASCPAGAASTPSYGGHAHQVIGQHQSATWTKGAIADPATFMVLFGKNRPTRPFSEVST